MERYRMLYPADRMVTDKQIRVMAKDAILNDEVDTPCISVSEVDSADIEYLIRILSDSKFTFSKDTTNAPL